MKQKILEAILPRLSDKNVRFEDLRKLLQTLGFVERIKGDHHIFYRERVAEIINLRPLRDGKAKAYQVKQVRNLVLKHKLHEEERDAQV